MKIIILAGGQPSTITEYNQFIPKPMAEIGEKPILWHLMKNFSSYGFNEFIICGGYQVNMIKEYFMDYYVYQSDITVDLETNEIQIHKKKTENWKVTVVDTGVHTSPVERIIQVKDYLEDQDFIVVHGDCLSDINFNHLVSLHKKSRTVATAVVAKPTGRSEILPITVDGKLMCDSDEKLFHNQGWANGCCHVFTKEIFMYLSKAKNLDINLYYLINEGKSVNIYRHNSFWIPVETKRDHNLLENLWNKSNAPWKKW